MTEHPVPAATTILVVDDEQSVRHFLQKALRRAGRRVVTASDGQQALRIDTRHHVDVVLLDLKMPGLSGMETLQRLLKADAGLVVIVLTGYGCGESACEALRLGACGCLTKPFDLAPLEEMIADGLQRKQKTAVATHQTEQ